MSSTIPTKWEFLLPSLEEIVATIGDANPEQAAFITDVLHRMEKAKWTPTVGPQADAYHCEADILLYGGQAGGGKSALITGLALMEHERTLIMRRQYSDLGAIIEDTLKQNGTRDGFNGSAPARLKTSDGKHIDFGGAKVPGDEEHWRGQPHDLLAIDEASQFLRSQVEFLMGWVRSTTPGQRTRVVFATNPPEKPAEGRWLFEMFAPWLDILHRCPAKPGELRWYVSDELGDDVEVDGPELFKVGDRMVQPLSRTFIPAALADNPYLAGMGYDARLDNLPEPLRSSVRDGNWMISHEDDKWQVIPTNWIMAAQERWTPAHPAHAPMCSMGVDVAQGGTHKTVISRRYDGWFDELISVPGSDTPLGSDVAGLVIKYRRNQSVVVIDMGGGYGGAALEHLRNQFNDDGKTIRAYNGANKPTARTVDRTMAFKNKRAQAHWQLREALDPDQEGGSPISLPPDPELLADLVSSRYNTTSGLIQLEDKEKARQLLGRSPDKGDAVIMALFEGPTHPTHGKIWGNALKYSDKPRVIRSHANRRR
jgi:hypothetical protein